MTPKEKAVSQRIVTGLNAIFREGFVSITIPRKKIDPLILELRRRRKLAQKYAKENGVELGAAFHILFPSP